MVVDDTAMLEAVFDHRLEYHRRDLHAVVLNFTIESQVWHIFHPYLLEVDIIADISHFLSYWHPVGTAVIDHESEHL